jgi:hypothetical protein
MDEEQSPPACDHTAFATRVAVRLVETLDDGRLRHEVALRVHCQGCGVPLTFELPPSAPGLVPAAVQSLDGTEARLAACLRVLAPVTEDAGWQVAVPLPEAQD